MTNTQASKLCSAGCVRTVYARGWCRAHYARWLRTGDVGPAKIRTKSAPPPKATAKQWEPGGYLTWLALKSNRGEE